MSTSAFNTTTRDDAVQTSQAKGWAQYEDDTYTSGSPLSITAAGGDVLLECDGAGSNTVTSELPSDGALLWDTTNDKFLSGNIGDAFDVRVDFDAKNTNVTGAFDMKIDIGDPSGIVIVERTLTFAKGANTEQHFSIGFPLYSMATFVANGAKIYINSITGDTTMYNISVFAKKDYHGTGSV